MHLKTNRKIFLFTLAFACCLRIGYSQEATDVPELSEEGAYTWIILPDLQNYQKFERNHPIFEMMINWIKNQRKNLNIQMVLTVGDLVDRSNVISYDDISKGDQSSIQQWQQVSGTFSKLNGVLPYILCTGNHDYGVKIAENRYSQFNSFFPPQNNPLTQSLLVEMAVNSQGVKTLENACYEWRSPFGQKFLLFSLEYAPRNEILEWAKNLASRPEYQYYIGVVITHSYLNSNNKRLAKEDYKFDNANNGEAIWNKFIKQSGNIRFVFCGHVCSSDEHIDQIGFSTEKNSQDINVHQMMFNTQREGGGIWGNGGDGWLRILEFMPDKRTLKVSTFSPLFYISPSTRSMSWRRESYDEFTITY